MRSLSQTRARRSSKLVPHLAMLAARPLAPQRPAAGVRLSAAPRRAAPLLAATPRASAAKADAPVSYAYSTIGPVAGAKVDELLSAIAGTEAGASATADDRRRVLALAAELELEYAKTGVRAALPPGAALRRHSALRCAQCGARKLFGSPGREGAGCIAPVLRRPALRSATRGRSCRCFWVSTA